MKSIDELVALGHRLMEEAETEVGLLRMRRAVRFRDGLMIGLLAYRPVRQKNFTSMRLGHHLTKVGGCWQILFAANETKTRVPYEATFPAALALRLERYLDCHRPVLMHGKGADDRADPRPTNPRLDAVWVSEVGTQLEQHALACRIIKHTKKAFGRSVSPHTIHAFCGDLLHERPIEAGIDPLFEVASEEEAEELADSAFEDWFQTDPPEGVRRILRRRSGRRSPREQLRNAMQTLREHRDFSEPWRRETFDRNGAIDALMTELSALGALAARSSWLGDYLTRNLAEISRLVDETTRLEAVRDRDYDGLESDLRAVARWRSWTWKGAPRTTFGSLSRDAVLTLRDQSKANLDAFIEASDADLAPLLHDALQTPLKAYEILKTKAGRLDFLDLLIKASDLLRDNAVVRRELQQRFSQFFVDEFQDTDPLQAESRLAGTGCSLSVGLQALETC